METETRVAETDTVPAINPSFQLPLTEPKLLAYLLETRYILAFLLKDDISPPSEAPGVAMCLAMTSIGGLALYVKKTLEDEDEGDGCLNIMGKLGERMRESVSIAYDLATQILFEKKPDDTFFADSVVSIYLPACSTNDDTSAGCTIITAFLSLAVNKPVRKDLAMTGTVTPNGKILGIGNVKEKTIGARPSQVKTIIFPEANRRDFDELAENVKEGLDVHFVDESEQIFELVFGYAIRRRLK